jgi:alpha-L-fucosidase
LLGIVVDDRGLVPEPDMQRLMEFGDEINRRFSNPNASTSGAGEKINLKLANKQKVNLVVLMEDIAKGERIRKFVLEGQTNKGWEKIFEGSCIGHKLIHQFDAIEVSSVRLNVLESSGEPQLLNISVYNVED